MKNLRVILKVNNETEFGYVTFFFLIKLYENDIYFNKNLKISISWRFLIMFIILL